MDAEALFIKMHQIRTAEEIIQREYFNDQIKTPVHLCVGAEAIAVGVLSEFSRPAVFGTYRNHHWYLATTDDFDGFWSELYAKEGAPNAGRAGSMHLSCPEKGYILSSAVVSSTIPAAVGYAWARGNMNEQTICFFGDGATEEGVFWESLNMACLKKVPVLFVCEDNQLSIHTAKPKRQSYDLAAVLKSFRCPYFYSSSVDVFDVQRTAAQAKSLLQQGPVFLHFGYERLLEHVGVREDYSIGYRTAPKGDLSSYDPIAYLGEQIGADRALELMKQSSDKVEQSWQRVQERADLKGMRW